MSTKKSNRDGRYWFDTGDWAVSTNVKRLNWMRKLLRPTAEQMQQILADTKALEQFVARAQAAMEKSGAGLDAEMNSTADDLLKSIDETGRKAIFLPPTDLLGRRDN
jgi:hypothetical protein